MVDKMVYPIVHMHKVLLHLKFPHNYCLGGQYLLLYPQRWMLYPILLSRRVTEINENLVTAMQVGTQRDCSRKVHVEQAYPVSKLHQSASFQAIQSLLSA